jgi:hypothetical protein
MKINQSNLDNFISHFHEYFLIKNETVKELFFKCFEFENEKLESLVKNELLCLDGGAFAWSISDVREKFIWQDELEEMLELKERGFEIDKGKEYFNISIDKAQKIFNDDDVLKLLKEKGLV